MDLESGLPVSLAFCGVPRGGWLVLGIRGTARNGTPSEPAWRPYACSALKGLQIGAWRMQRICRHRDRRWIVLSMQPHASRKCFKPGMSARLTLANCACKNVWRRRRRTCLTGCDIEVEIGALVAPVGVSRGFKRESRNLTEMNK
jgi:hypothetical protein